MPRWSWSATRSFFGGLLQRSQDPEPFAGSARSRCSRTVRHFWPSLGFFLQSFAVPAGSSREERELYLRFIERLDDSGALKPGAGQKIREDLRRAMEA